MLLSPPHLLALTYRPTFSPSDAPDFRICPIIKHLPDTFICFQPLINLMAFIRRFRNQNWLFPPSIADLIEEDHICRLVDEVVDDVDLKKIEKRYDCLSSPAYHPRLMMKLLVQSTINGTKIKASTSNFNVVPFLLQNKFQTTNTLNL